MSIEYSAKIKSSSLDFSITIETYEEHHMGSSTVMIITSSPIDGVSQFQTTNGDAFFTQDGSGLVIEDHNIILYVELRTSKVFHYEPPAGHFFKKSRMDVDSLLVDFGDHYWNPSGSLAIPIAELKNYFRPGFGSVANGRFPSAWPKQVR